MDKLQHNFRGEIPTYRQFGINDVRLVGVPCLIGITLDVDRLVKNLGEKALKSKGKRATAFYGALILEVKEI